MEHRASDTARSDDLARLNRIRRIARLMDSRWRLPVIGTRIGLDGIAGLIPGIGDSLGLVVSAWIMVEAHRMGAGRGVLLRMAGNAVIDWGAGSVPVVGDIFDIGFRSHLRNLRLLEEALGVSPAGRG